MISLHLRRARKIFLQAGGSGNVNDVSRCGYRSEREPLRKARNRACEADSAHNLRLQQRCRDHQGKRDNDEGMASKTKLAGMTRSGTSTPNQSPQKSRGPCWCSKRTTWHRTPKKPQGDERREAHVPMAEELGQRDPAIS